MRSSRALSSGWSCSSSGARQQRAPAHLHHRPRIRQITTTSSRSAKHRSPYRSITKVELDRIAAARASLHPEYTSAEKEDLKRQYTPAQLEAIEAGEAAVNPLDLANAGRRHDVLAPKGDDKFNYSRMQPTIDKHLSRIRGEWDNYDDNSPYKYSNPDYDEDKHLKRISDIMLDPSDNPLDDRSERIIRTEESDDPNSLAPPTRPNTDPGVILGRLWQQATSGEPEVAKQLSREVAARSNSDEEVDDATFERLASPNIPGSRQPHPTGKSTNDRLLKALSWGADAEPAEFAPEIPRIDDPKVRWDDGSATDENAVDDETAEAYKRLAKIMHTTPDQLRKFRTKILVSHRVVNQTRLGKISQQYFLCVAGDEKGMVGIGEGKASEPDAGQRLARLAAIRAMVPVRRYENRTIYGEVKGKCGAVELTISSRPPGSGLRVSQHIFEIARCAGISDLGAKVTRSRNPMNVVKAVWQALQEQKDPEEIARARGKKLVDVRKVYYAGLV